MDFGVEKATADAEQGVEHEHRLDGRQLIDPRGAEKFRHRRSERAEGGAEGTDQAVAGEHSGAAAVGQGAAEHRMFQRHEHTDARAEGLIVPANATTRRRAKSWTTA